MRTYAYRARSLTTGRQVRGTARAGSPADLMEQLRQAGYVPLSIRSSGWADRLSRLLRQLEPLQPRDRAVFYRQMATMLQAGLPVTTALEVLTQQGRGGGGEAAAAVHRELVRGAQLAEAMEQSGVAFPAVHISLVRAGELSGRLAEVLDRLAGAEEKDAALRGKVRAALLYPSVVLAVALAVLTFMVLVVVPSFLSIFADLQAELPALTQGLLAFLTVLRRHGHLVVLALAAVGFGLRFLGRTAGGRRLRDRWRLRVPVLGKLQGLLLLGSLGRTMAMLLGSGLPLLQALEAAGDALGNALYRSVLADVGQGVNRGESLADSMALTGAIPAFVVEMVRVGEQSGALEEMFAKVAESYDRQADEMVANLTALLEPVMLLVVGGLVAFILISLFLPILTLLNAVDTAF